MPTYVLRNWAAESRWPVMLYLAVATFSFQQLITGALTPLEPPTPRDAADSPETVRPPAWLLSSSPRLDRSFWNRAADLRLPLHRPLKLNNSNDRHRCTTRRDQCSTEHHPDDVQARGSSDGKPPSECQTRDEMECISGFRRESTDVSVHYAGDIEMMIILPLHRRATPVPGCGVDCHDVDGVAALLKLELVHFLTQTLNSLSVFGFWSFGTEILDSCSHVGHIQRQLLTYGKVSDISACAQNESSCVEHLRKNASGSCPRGKVVDGCLGKCQKRGVRSLLIGPGRNSLCRDTAPFASQYSLSQISYGATLPVLSDMSEFPDFFRTVPSDKLLMKALAGVLGKLDITHVTLLVEDEPFGKRLMREFEKQYSTKCTAKTVFFSEVRTDGLEKAFQLLSKTSMRTAIVVLGQKRASKQIFHAAASLESRADLLFFASHVDERLLQEGSDLNIVTLSPVPQLHRFSQRAWKEVRSQITDRITSLKFSHTDLTAHQLMKNITEHFHLRAKCPRTANTNNDTCGSGLPRYNRCLVDHLEQEIASFFDEFEAENELKRLMESIMTGTEVIRSVLNGVAARCQNYTTQENATLELTRRRLTDRLRQEGGSGAGAGGGSSNVTQGCLNKTQESRDALDGHWCQAFLTLLQRRQQFTPPGQPVPLSNKLFCNLRHRHLSEEMQKRNLRGDSVEQAAYDIIAMGQLTSLHHIDRARNWTTIGHWEANGLDPFAGTSPGQLAIVKAIRHMVSSRFHTSCHPRQCPLGHVKQMIEGVDVCCFLCRSCKNSAVSSANSTECVKCPHCHLPNLVIGGSECLPIPVTKSDWDHGWAIAMAALSVLVCGAIVFAAFWSLHQVEKPHKAKKQSSLRRLTSTSSSVTTTSTDSVSAKPGKSRYVLFSLLLAGCQLVVLLPWSPSKGLCMAQQLLVPFVTPLTCASMMLSIINHHRLMFITELMRGKREDATIGGHHYMKNGLQYITIAVVSAILGANVLGMAMASESVMDVCLERTRHLQCTVSVAGSAAYFVVTWTMWAVLFAYALYSFVSAENAGVIFSRPSSIAWALLSLLFLWTLLLPARFVLPQVNAVTLVALVNNLHTCVVLTITCLADIRVVRRRQRTSSSLYNGSQGNATTEQHNSASGGARNGGAGSGGGNGGAMLQATTATAATYLHSHAHSQTTNVLVSPLSPSQGVDNGKSVTTPDDTAALAVGSGGKAMLFTFAVANVTEEVDPEAGSAGNGADGLKRPASSLSRNPSVLNPVAPSYEDSLAITHISLFNTGPPKAPLSPLPVEKATAL